MGEGTAAADVDTVSAVASGHIYISVASTKKSSGTGAARRRGRGFSTSYLIMRSSEFSQLALVDSGRPQVDRHQCAASRCCFPACAVA
jgi:hypothetical protein